MAHCHGCGEAIALVSSKPDNFFHQLSDSQIILASLVVFVQTSNIGIWNVNLAREPPLKGLCTDVIYGKRDNYIILLVKLQLSGDSLMCFTMGYCTAHRNDAGDGCWNCIALIWILVWDSRYPLSLARQSPQNRRNLLGIYQPHCPVLIMLINFQLFTVQVMHNSATLAHVNLCKVNDLQWL